MEILSCSLAIWQYMPSVLYYACGPPTFQETVNMSMTPRNNLLYAPL